MSFNPLIHRRKAMRLKGYDYSQPGMYFVTICVQGHKCALGKVTDGEMHFSQLGKIGHDGRTWLDSQYEFVNIDLFCVMPNHTHAIIHILGTTPRRGGSRTTPTKPLDGLIGAYKTHTTKTINRLSNSPNTPFWQRSFYDHIIRDDEDLENIQEYILSNALKWELDQDHPNQWKTQITPCL